MWTLPLMALLSIPIIFGMSDLYLWARPEVVVADEILQHKAGYLNTGAFIIRIVVYFVIWIALGYCLSQWSLEQDRTGDSALTSRLSFISGPGLPVIALTITFSAIDWAMSLDPHWFSTLYGLLSSRATYSRPWRSASVSLVGWDTRNHSPISSRPHASMTSAT